MLNILNDEVMRTIFKTFKVTVFLFFAATIFLFAQTGKKANEVINNWPEESKKVAETIIDKYGEPDGVTDMMLIWQEVGDWKRVIVNKEPVEHHFPMKHVDIVEQVIDYQVPVDKFDELAEYDGSVIVERTKGEISARCDKEEANYLAINLAHDIIEGKLSVEEARTSYAENVKKLMNGEKPDYTQEFQFELPTGEVADPGTPIINKSSGR